MSNPKLFDKKAFLVIKLRYEIDCEREYVI